MATKIILHGGYAGHQNIKNDAFFKEILSGTSESPNVLMVFFAKEEDRVPKNREETIAQFERNKGDKFIKYNTANKNSFPEQIQRADVIYLHGGNTLKLIETLKQFGDIKRLFTGKIVAGESAGAYALSSYFYSIREEGVFEGLGFIPIETICHYTPKYEHVMRELPRKAELLLLPNYTYKVFEY